MNAQKKNAIKKKEMYIDTSESSKNFAKLLDTHKTYFLNGAWGTGKTVFLEEAEEYSKQKFVFLDLWQIKDERSVIAIAFQKMHPVLILGFKFVCIACVVISVLMTNVVNLGLSRHFDSYIFSIAGVIALFVAVWSFFKVKSDYFYIRAFAILIFFKVKFDQFYEWVFKKAPLGGKVLILDDFDRVAPERQEQAYLLFNILNGKMPIVFVGDYNNLMKNEDKYLQKIIDRRVELPFVLHSSNIWKDYFDKLSVKLGAQISNEFIQVVISENRNLRERKHFDDFVNQEFFERGKLNHVQVNDQLQVIYIFLFHIGDYNELVNGKRSDLLIIPAKKADNTPQGQDDDVYPLPYKRDKLAYFLYESISNMTVAELESIFDDENKLEDNLLSEYNTDFYQYVTSEYKNFSQERKDYILSKSLDMIKQFKSSRLISFVIREKEKEIMPPKTLIEMHGSSATYAIPEERAGKTDEEIDNEIFAGWLMLLKGRDFDFSMQLYFFERFWIFSFQKLGERFPDIKFSRKQTRRDFLLLVYIASKDLWNKYEEWSDELWNEVFDLPDDQFILFSMIQEIISNGKDVRGLEFVPEDKKYIVWTSKYDFFTEKELPQQFIVDKIKPKLDELQKRGYDFTFEVDEKYKSKYK
jgi:KAP family P-loop domain.